MAKKVLIIEDEEVVRSLLQRRLTDQGYKVLLAKDGDEGVRAIRGEKPDLILLDMVMPKKGGFEVLEEIQKDEELRGVPVVIISNSGQPVELDRARRLGVKDWLIKTEFDPSEVIEKVKRQIG